MPIFLPVRHCFRGCSKINLKVYEVIYGLNKTLGTHFIWYLGKKKRCDIETLSIDRVLNKEHFYGKYAEHMHHKLVPDPLLILVNNPKQSLHAINFFENKIFWKRILKKSLKSELYFFFRTHSLSTYKVIRNKRGLELVPRCSSGYKASLEKFFY